MSLAAPALFDILLRVYSDLGELQFGLATGGSSTTLVDSGIGGSDDDWNGGTVFITEADSAAPVAEFAEITDYATSSGTLTFASSGINGLSSAPAADDEYALASSLYTLDYMRGVVNRALVRMGNITVVDESLTTAANQKEYTIPGAAVKDNLREVWIAPVSTANNEGWVLLPKGVWRQELNILIFQQQPVSGKTLKLVYMGLQTRLAAFGDAISADIPLNRVVAEAVYLVRTSRKSSGRERAEAEDDLLLARQRWPIHDPGKPSKLMIIGSRARRDQFTTPDPP